MDSKTIIDKQKAKKEPSIWHFSIGKLCGDIYGGGLQSPNSKMLSLCMEELVKCSFHLDLTLPIQWGRIQNISNKKRI